MRGLRRKDEEDYLACLRACQEKILLAGGLRKGPETGSAGGLWAHDVASLERACEFAGKDPCFRHS